MSRHTEIRGVFDHGRPVRDGRSGGSTVNIIVHSPPASAKPAHHRDAKTGTARVTAALAALGRKMDATAAKLGRTSGGLDRAADAARLVADSRRGTGFRGRV